MANILYLGSTPLIDLSGYATKLDTSIFASTSYVDDAVAAVDVSEQLSDYVLKDGDKVLSTNDFTDALLSKLNGLSNYDDTSVTAALNAVKSTLADITTDGSTDAILNTWSEIKNFIADYTTANDLKDVIDTVESNIQTYVNNQGYLTSADLSGYLTSVDASTIYVKKNDVSTLEESFRVAAAAISALDNRATALDSSVTAIEADYVKSNDVSAFVTSSTLASTLNDYVTDNDASVYLKANDVSTKVNSQSVLNIATISAADFEVLDPKDPSTLYIVL